MSNENDKPVDEKVKESITILNKLKEIGIADTEPGYKEIKDHMNTWIRNGEAWSGKINFERYGRRAELILPSRKGRVSSLKLLAIN